MKKASRWFVGVAASLLIVACDQMPTDIDQASIRPVFSTNSYPSAARIYFTAGGQELGFSNPASIQRVNADGTGLTTILALPAPSRPTGLAIDQANGHLYVNDWNFRTTQRLNLDGSGVTLIQTWPAGCGLLNLALDVPGNKIYSTSGACFRRVSRFNLDGTGSFQVLASNTGVNAFFPDGIALDLANGHVYYGDPGIAPNGIRRMNLDGSGNITLIPPSAFPPTNGCAGNAFHGRGRGMALDLAAGKMYFAGHPRLTGLISCPPGLGEIWSANLDGTGLTLLVGGLEKPDGVALDLGAGKAYWTDGKTGKIQRANLDGSSVQDVLTGIPTPRALVLEPSPVEIDIKPGSDPSSFGCKSKGSIPVAILGSANFDVTTVDANSVLFGKTGNETGEVHVNKKTGDAKRHEEDFNNDGFLDLIFHFDFQSTGFSCADIPAGQNSITLDGTLTGVGGSGPFSASSDIRLTGGN